MCVPSQPHRRVRANNEPHDPIMKVTPRLVLLHTLAHVLIDQWALESGYSASALRERIYCTPERAWSLDLHRVVGFGEAVLAA